MSDITQEIRKEKESKDAVQPVPQASAKKNTHFGTGLYGMPDEQMAAGMPGYVADSGLRQPRYYMETGNDSQVIQLSRITSSDPVLYTDIPDPQLPKDQDNPTMVFESMGKDPSSCISIYNQTCSYKGNTICVFGINEEIKDIRQTNKITETLMNLNNRAKKEIITLQPTYDPDGNCHLLYVFPFVWQKATGGGYEMPFIEARLLIMEKAKAITDSFKARYKDLKYINNRYLYRWIDADAENDTTQELASVQWSDSAKKINLLNVLAMHDSPVVIGGGYDWRHEVPDKLVGKPNYTAFIEQLNWAERSVRTKFHALLVQRNIYNGKTAPSSPLYYVPEPTLLMNEAAHHLLLDGSQNLKNNPKQSRESEQILDPSGIPIIHVPDLYVQKPVKNEFKISNNDSQGSYLGNELLTFLKTGKQVKQKFFETLNNVRQSAFGQWSFIKTKGKDIWWKRTQDSQIEPFDLILQEELNQHKRACAESLWDFLTATSLYGQMQKQELPFMARNSHQELLWSQLLLEKLLPQLHLEEYLKHECGKIQQQINEQTKQIELLRQPLKNQIAFLQKQLPLQNLAKEDKKLVEEKGTLLKRIAELPLSFQMLPESEEKHEMRGKEIEQFKILIKMISSVQMPKELQAFKVKRLENLQNRLEQPQDQIMSPQQSDVNINNLIELRTAMNDLQSTQTRVTALKRTLDGLRLQLMNLQTKQQPQIQLNLQTLHMLEIEEQEQTLRMQSQKNENKEVNLLEKNELSQKLQNLKISLEAYQNEEKKLLDQMQPLQRALNAIQAPLPGQQQLQALLSDMVSLQAMQQKKQNPKKGIPQEPILARIQKEIEGIK